MNWLYDPMNWVPLCIVCLIAIGYIIFNHPSSPNPPETM